MWACLSTISSKLSLDRELDRRIGTTASIVARLDTHVWKIPDSRSRPRGQCITRVLLVHFYTEANAGQNIPLNSIDWMSSICAHCGSCSRYIGWTEHQIQLLAGSCQTNGRWHILYGELLKKAILGVPSYSYWKFYKDKTGFCRLNYENSLNIYTSVSQIVHLCTVVCIELNLEVTQI